MSKSIFVRHLGKMKYLEAWQLQKKLAKEVYANVKLNKNPEHKLLIVEHWPGL